MVKRRAQLAFVGILCIGIALFAIWFFSKPNTQVVGPPTQPTIAVRKKYPSSAKPAAAPRREITPRPSEEPGPGVIRGTVYRLDGGFAAAEVVVRPVANAVLLYDPFARKIHTVTCNSAGQFKVTQLPLGTFAVSASLGSEFAVQQVILRPTEDYADITLLLYPGGALAGSVVNESGDPIAGARLRPLLRDGDASASDLFNSVEAISDENGTFAFAALHPHSWELHVSADGYAAQVSASLAVGTTDNVITLSKGVIVSGTVTRASDDVPIADITVTAKMNGLNAMDARAKTDSSGMFQLPPLGKGRYTIDVLSDTLVLEDGPVELAVNAESPSRWLSLRALDGGIVCGHIADGTTNEGIPAAGLRARPKGKLGRIMEATSAEDGAFEFTGLSQGAYTITPYALNGYPRKSERQKNADVVVEPGGVVEGVEILAFRDGFVSGIVLDSEDKAVPGATVDIEVKQMNFFTKVTAGGDGTFTFADFSGEQDLTLHASASQGSSETVEVHVPATGKTDVVLRINSEPTGSIGGTVVDKQGKPIEVVLGAQGAKNPANGFAFLSTSADGQFFAKGLIADEYTIRAARKNIRSTDIAVVSIAPGQEVRGLRLVLPVDTVTISGKVVDSEGNPVSASLQFSHVVENTSMPGPIGRSRHDGIFTAEVSEEGLYAIEVKAKGYQSQNVQVQSGDSNVMIAMVETDTLQGRVIDANTQKPVTTFEIAVLTGALQVDELPGPGEFQLFNNSEGRFSLPLESYGKLFVRARGYQPARVTATADLLVSLQPGDIGVQGRVFDSNGVGLFNVAIFVGPLSQRTRYRLSQAATRSGDGGKYEIHGLASGSITLSAFDPVHGSGSAIGEIAAGQSGPIDIHLQPVAVVEGVVARGGEAIARAMVTLTDESGATFRSVSDADGHYLIDDVASGSVTVSVELDDKHVEKQQIDVRPGEQVTLDFDLASIVASP
jgi:protocatechuate 3,4-dioxygenase beta subunit